MNVMILLLFVGIVLATAALAFFVWNVRSGALDHAERLALLPLRAEAHDAGTERGIRAVQGSLASQEGPR
jgi:cbb3-type cytochrome oxidase maturation protein